MASDAEEILDESMHGQESLCLTGRFCSPAVSTRLDEDVDDVAILIDCTPEILPLSLDGDEVLVQVPCVSQATLAALQSTSVFRPELDAPKSDGFI